MKSFVHRTRPASLPLLALALAFGFAFLAAPQAEAVPEWCSAICNSSAPCSSTCWDGFSTTCAEYGVCCSGATRVYTGVETFGPWRDTDGLLCTNKTGQWLFYCYYEEVFRTCQERDVFRQYRYTECDGSIRYATEYYTVETSCSNPIVIRTFRDAFCNADTGCVRANP